MIHLNIVAFLIFGGFCFWWGGVCALWGNTREFRRLMRRRHLLADSKELPSSEHNQGKRKK